MSTKQWGELAGKILVWTIILSCKAIKLTAQLLAKLTSADRPSYSPGAHEQSG